MTGKSLPVFFFVLFLAVTLTAGEIHVLPVVADKVAGRNNSVWDTEIRIFSQVPPGEDLVVRRAWVALEGGGFEDDPESAPEWRLSDEILEACPGGIDYPSEYLTLERRKVIILDGAALLEGADRNVGAVGLEIEGEAIVLARITDVAGEEAENLANIQVHFQLLGLGQVVYGQRQALSGPVAFPWLTPDPGRAHGPCTWSDPCNWRNNLGIVNPSQEPLKITLWAMSLVAAPYFLADRWCEPDEDNQIWPGVAGDIYLGGSKSYRPTLEIEVPPWGWMQIDNIDYRFFKDFPAGGPYPLNWWSSVMSLNVFPESDDRPYYTYLSQVFSGSHDRNDPAYILPIQGSLIDIADFPTK